MASNKARAIFALYGYHFHPDVITEKLGIEPTETDDSGAESGLDSPVISSWTYATDLVDGDMEPVDVYKITEQILKKFEPVKDKIMELCKSHNLSPRINVELELSVDKDDDCPDVGFGARTLKFVSEIGAFINIDYKLSDRI